MGDVDTFQRHRPLLQAIAYRLLGTASEAEDVVQDAFLRWRDVDGTAVAAPRAYLTRTVTRLCLDLRASARGRREHYVGTWLPEPVADEAAPDGLDAVRLAESLQMSFLVLLEQLTPVERAAFLLREVFEYDYPEVADAIGKSTDNCRQLVHRARAHLHRGRARFDASAERGRDLALRFQAAAATGDHEGLVACLAQDAKLWSDGGGADPRVGRARALRRPIDGAQRIAAVIHAVLGQAPDTLRGVVTQFNNQPAIAALDGDRLQSVIILEVRDAAISSLYVITNPAKLRGVDLAPS